MSCKTSVLRQRYRREPEFGNLPIAFYVNVRWLSPIRTEEDRAYGPSTKTVGIVAYLPGTQMCFRDLGRGHALQSQLYFIPAIKAIGDERHGTAIRRKGGRVFYRFLEQ